MFEWLEHVIKRMLLLNSGLAKVRCKGMELVLEQVFS